MPEYNLFDLEAAVKKLASTFDVIEAIYLFGSRRFGTGSTRSDVDIIIVPKEYIKPSLLRNYVLETNTALDIFVLMDGRAISVANESYISGVSNEDVLKILNAKLLYEPSTGSSEYLQKLQQLELDSRVQYELTSLPNSSTAGVQVQALIKMMNSCREKDLPTRPYLGQSTREASEFIIKIIRSLPGVGQSVTGYQHANGGWTTNLRNEYDFQNLFWIVCKPWLPELTREPITIQFDGNDKLADFSLFRNQLIIELKHVKDDNTKRSIVKTLVGLKDFYEQHPNVRVLIFGILVDDEVDLDGALWEASYTFTDNTPSVHTVVVRNIST
jgi:predicted nucleotidyltransferase